MLLHSLLSFVVFTHAQSLDFTCTDDERCLSAVLTWDAAATTIADPTWDTAFATIAAPTSLPSSTFLPCNDPSWFPSPENWVIEDVDQKLANTNGSWGSTTTFVDYIANITGEPELQCGIGDYSACIVPDCTAFQNANGQKWLYFVAVSVVEMNSFFNIMNDGIQGGTLDLDLVIGQMANAFFPWNSQSTQTNVWRWVGATVSSVLSFVPLAIPPPFKDLASPLLQTAAAFANAGLSNLTPQNSDVQAYSLVTAKLGTTFKALSDSALTALDQWSQTLFDGKPDASEKTIIDYFAGGRFTLNYNISEQEMRNFYFQTMVSNVVNDQWTSPIAPTKQFVMCTNGTSTCNETSVYSEGGRTCCLYSLDHKGRYAAPHSLDILGNSTYNINASSITAGSLHSYLARGLHYNKNDTNRLVEASISGNSTEQAFIQGVKFQGIWTIPVCDVGNNGSMVANYKAGILPCCCGPANSSGTGCTETNDFFNATHLNFKGFQAIDKWCKNQVKGFIPPPSAAAALGVPLMGSLFLHGHLTVVTKAQFGEALLQDYKEGTVYEKGHITPLL
ncbi:hypothetical protein AOQ84DRAFT_376449 [Glonium stellatum]|uniref:Uncharacterized protein n=1 Tax=Glonium stellatum TaxID=574774 RepID=A0A8E2JTC0_9PEZI|nr:hypothetical protein AOQ84DRAFT_376449 [Glonium stellatum]